MLHFDLFMILLDSMKHHFNLESAKKRRIIDYDVTV